MSLSQATFEGVEPTTQDPYEIGWYIESADEDIYGPVSRDTIQRFLVDGTISPNTLVRHCTQPESRPAADQTALGDQAGEAKAMPIDGDAGLYDREHDAPAGLVPRGKIVGDRLDQAWPRKKRDQQALGEGKIPCCWHKQPAVLLCVRCHAPYCNKCRAKPFRKQFFLCKRCQSGFHNRRFGALILDTIILVYVPTIAVSVGLAASGVVDEQTALLVNGLLNVVVIALLFGKDALFGGAGIGKRASGLRVVKSKDGTSPLSYGQGVLRWLSQFIPFFNLADAIVPYSDPLCRRFGDRWAGTRVIDTDRKLEKDRAKIARRLIKKGVQLPPRFGMTMEEMARIDG